MTQNPPEATPTRTVAERVKELRQQRGWTAAELAARCADKGLDGLNRNVVANLESGRRSYVTVEELLTLAYVLDVAPIHLLIPVEMDERPYWVTPDVPLPVPQARAWVRGEYAPGVIDPRRYFSEVPRDEWQPPRLTEEQVEERGERAQRHRWLEDTLFPPGDQAKAREELRRGEH